MRVDSQRVKVQGHLLHRLTLHPDEDVPVRMGAIFYHGQGDYADRYAEVLGPFTDRGIRCVVTDLPGHGYSPGRRGHSGDESLLDAIIDDTLKSFDGMPYGVMGHSMGGLLAVRHLVRAGQGRFPVPSLAWVNAPLIQPSYGRSRAFLTMVHAVAPLFPEFTMSTGVTSAMCRVKSEGGSEGAKSVVKERVKHQLWHRRISLGWGVALFRMEKLLVDSLGEMPSEMSIIVTQGGDDPVCPAEITRSFFEKLPQQAKEYHEFEGGLHELFSEDGNPRLFNTLHQWLDGVALLNERC